MRGLPVARGFIPAGLQSSPKTCQHGLRRHTACQQVAPATQPSGDKSPRHKDAAHIPMMCLCGHGFSWLADLSVIRGLPVARGFIPVGLQSSPKTCQHGFYRHTACEQVAPATQPSGDKSPRHKEAVHMPGCCQCEGFRRLADLSVMRGLPVARGFIPVGLQSSPKTCQHGFYRHTACEQIAPATQPSGDKSPRHKEAVPMPGCCQCEEFRRLADLSVLQGLPVARGFIPAGLQSSPKTCHHSFYRPTACEQIAPATQPSGDKSPRHKDAVHILMMCLCERWTPCG